MLNSKYGVIISVSLSILTSRAHAGTIAINTIDGNEKTDRAVEMIASDFRGDLQIRTQSGQWLTISRDNIKKFSADPLQFGRSVVEDKNVLLRCIASSSKEADLCASLEFHIVQAQ